MAYNSANLTLRSAGGYISGITIWDYTTTDDLADIEVVDGDGCNTYFVADGGTHTFREGDFIAATADDGNALYVCRNVGINSGLSGQSFVGISNIATVDTFVWG
jgi:hypothetical protein